MYFLCSSSNSYEFCFCWIARVYYLYFPTSQYISNNFLIVWVLLRHLSYFIIGDSCSAIVYHLLHHFRTPEDDPYIPIPPSSPICPLLVFFWWKQLAWSVVIGTSVFGLIIRVCLLRLLGRHFFVLDMINRMCKLEVQKNCLIWFA